jgi:hypothetical protein
MNDPQHLLDWLLATIREREEAATAAARHYGGRWVRGIPERHKDPGLRYGWDEDWVHLSETDPHLGYQCFSDEIAVLTVLHDSESVLRRCKSDRKLLELHGGRGHGCPTYDYDGDLDEFARFYNHEVCPVISSLAESYGWREGEGET